jgi:CRP/FNR family cyclic AMP-dependent transcriptional regulator
MLHAITGRIPKNDRIKKMLEKTPGPTASDQEKDLVEFIINLPLFEFLERNDLFEVAARMDFVDLDTGEVLFHEWDRADFVCFIESGELDVTKKTGPDSSEVMATLKRGRSIGEMSIINNFPRSSTVVARSKVRLAVFPRSGFEDILAKKVDIGINILKGLATLLSINLKKTSSRLSDNMLPMG